MGHTNRDRRYVRVTSKDTRIVRRLRRRAEKRALRGEHTRTARRATKRGWWHA